MKKEPENFNDSVPAPHFKCGARVVSAAEENGFIVIDDCYQKIVSDGEVVYGMNLDEINAEWKVLSCSGDSVQLYFLNYLDGKKRNNIINTTIWVNFKSIKISENSYWCCNK